MNYKPNVEFFLEALSAAIESFFPSPGIESASTLEEEEDEEVEARRAAGRALCLKLCRRRFRKQ